MDANQLNNVALLNNHTTHPTKIADVSFGNTTLNAIHQLTQQNLNKETSAYSKPDGKPSQGTVFSPRSTKNQKRGKRSYEKGNIHHIQQDDGRHLQSLQAFLLEALH